MNSSMNTFPRSRLAIALIHVIGWGFVFGFPFLMMSRSGFSITLADYLSHGFVVPLAFLVVFYVNYLGLIPRYLFAGHMRSFLLLNLLLIAVTACGTQLWQELMHQLLAADLPRITKGHHGPPRWVFVARDLFSMVLTIGFSTAIRLSARWLQIEADRREAERIKTEAELKNLRNQLNPHFLLNTLNNIYALIAFNADKAQEAVQELSRLLRHVLYDNQQSRVPLVKEMDFIRSYIELMRIRLASHVTLTTHFDISPDSGTQIAPLIFISLIENAFKHGISPTQPSYIDIRLSESTTAVCCDIRNSNHPKSLGDKSGSGIGLEQVKRRLELTYPGHYHWQQGLSADGREYHSQLTILMLSVNELTSQQGRCQLTS